MSLEASVAHHDGYTTVVLRGTPTLGDLLVYLEELALQSREWQPPFVLFDIREIQTLTAFTEQFQLGQAVALRLRHLRRIASLVPEGRRTGTSQKVARSGGANLMVFTDRAAAVAWVRGQPA